MIIVSLLPELLNVNGDAQNANVLQKRAAWAGIPAKLVDVNRLKDMPRNPDLVVIGSGVDSDLPEARKLLLEGVDELRALVTKKIALLAVGTGWELLSWGIEFADRAPIEGLAVFAGRAVPAPARRVGDIVVDSKLGELVGFENHARDYVGVEQSALGVVKHGWGNGGAGEKRLEGVRMGTAIGTHLHGPVTAKNPALADRLLHDAARHAGVKYRVSAEAERVDGWAKQARQFTLDKMAGA